MPKRSKVQDCDAGCVGKCTCDDLTNPRLIREDERYAKKRIKPTKEDLDFIVPDSPKGKNARKAIEFVRSQTYSKNYYTMEGEECDCDCHKEHECDDGDDCECEIECECDCNDCSCKCHDEECGEDECMTESELNCTECDCVCHCACHEDDDDEGECDVCDCANYEEYDEEFDPYAEEEGYDYEEEED